VDSEADEKCGVGTVAFGNWFSKLIFIFFEKNKNQFTKPLSKIYYAKEIILYPDLKSTRCVSSKSKQNPNINPPPPDPHNFNL
jgi:hypothetical protein